MVTVGDVSASASGGEGTREGTVRIGARSWTLFFFAMDVYGWPGLSVIARWDEAELGTGTRFGAGVWAGAGAVTLPRKGVGSMAA